MPEEGIQTLSEDVLFEIVEPIITYLKSQAPTTRQLFGCFEAVGKAGDSVLFKKDGMRSTDLFTVLVIPGDQSFRPISLDAESLHRSARSVFGRYLRAKGNPFGDFARNVPDLPSQSAKGLIGYLDSPNPTTDDLLACFEVIGDDGDIVYLEHHGAENDSPYWVTVSGPAKGIATITHKSSDLFQAAHAAFADYLEATGVI